MRNVLILIYEGADERNAQREEEENLIYIDRIGQSKSEQQSSDKETGFQKQSIS